ncbi:MAG: class II fructose-1,6-bisphosphate aldolase [Bacilli bacterium]|jgi:fructose-bisphosphate aldolase class II/6-phospho-5-dehydro-2-deoxy-D-gluconate aldolase|nr:class II fructose-1,6-bisphosphate aldolase [Bacilli bacterium]MDD2681618.1 class II fructose-1,6-bisphosphate aldolase [Bacilli bacterium]MDD3120815.1 class II fructose-1,6-bisphosphate aldolase [Bacilli bacterium]MDD4063010.1 class II fructose-1,6-bisphosphate aldolase [Bacilli bacterium]MDD4481710.1 class II fructose-1,6-bisphosphate aldolase [Bacilli bacterium]
MALVNMVDMLNKAKDEKYAVGQFNINNLEWTKTILKVSEELNSPVILGVSEGAAKYMGGFNTVVGMVKGMIKDLKINVDVAIHLDHGTTFESCKASIDAGFTSVMIDGSHHPIDENIRLTKQVVDYARPRGVSVEAEVGTVGGTEDGITGGINYADKDECVRLVNETKVDCLAPALGSVHGIYQGEPKLGFKEMLEIKEATNKPLVLHGGTGIPDEQIKKAIERGTSKINVNTECQLAFARELRALLATNNEVYDPRKILGPASVGIKIAVETKMKLFGSVGKAVK